MIYVFGLGNPGKEYENSRHNAGRLVLEYFRKSQDFPEFEMDGKAKSLISKSKKVTLVLPETFMNNSGKSVGFFVKSKKAAADMIVVYDDLDLPLGDMKISFNKGTGGHNGLESIVKAVKTREFARIRIGVSGATPKGKIKKPSGEDAVIKHILGNFKPSEEAILKKVIKKASEALNSILTDGLDRAMNTYN